MVEVASQPHVCSPLSVVSNSENKQQLVINLRYLNGYLQKEKFKYEDLRTAMLLFQQGDYMFFLTLSQDTTNLIYLGLTDNFGVLLGKGRIQTILYIYCVITPLRLATVCYAFTKLLRPLVKYWRSHLDDGIIAVSAAAQASHKVRQDLRDAGLVEHIEKCNWVPTQQITWLGFLLDLDKGQIFVPTDKVEQLKSSLVQVLDRPTLKARNLSSIIGKLISMSLAVGPVA